MPLSLIVATVAGGIFFKTATNPFSAKRSLISRQKDYMKGDERILGDSDYVDEILGAANERLQRTYQLKALGLNVDKVAERVAALLTLPVEAVWAVGKHRKTVAARSLLCYWSVRQLGLSISSLARRLGISSTSVSQSVVRGELLAKKRNYKLVK
jgi:hypothetical protein